jgi:arylformamidase
MDQLDGSWAAALAQGEWFDVSRPLRSTTPVWPGDRSFELRQRRGPGFVLSSFETTCHIGTHVDAPLHLDPSLTGIEKIPIGRCAGPAEVVVLPAMVEPVGPADLPVGWEPIETRVLFRTDSHPIDEPISAGFTGLSAELVDWLADRGVELVGIDTPSVDVFDSEDVGAHRALLARGMTWIEGLWLTDIEPGRYFLVALPILLEGAEAAPVRAILKPISSEF